MSKATTESRVAKARPAIEAAVSGEGDWQKILNSLLESGEIDQTVFDSTAEVIREGV